MLHTFTTEETENAGRELAMQLIERADELIASDENIFVAFFGNLGAGKTAFIRGMAQVIAPGAPVSSPTFAIMNEYAGEKYTLCHFDMYRITNDDDLYSVGFYDLDGVIIVAEWCENIEYALPKHYFSVNITNSPENDGSRFIEISEVGSDETV